MCWLPIETLDEYKIKKSLMFEDKSSKGIICEYCIAKDDENLDKMCVNCIYYLDKEV